MLTEGSKIAQNQNFKVNPFFKDNSQPSRSNLKPNELNLSYSDATDISFPDNLWKLSMVGVLRPQFIQLNSSS